MTVRDPAAAAGDQLARARASKASLNHRSRNPDLPPRLSGLSSASGILSSGFANDSVLWVQALLFGAKRHRCSDASRDVTLKAALYQPFLPGGQRQLFDFAYLLSKQSLKSSVVPGAAPQFAPNALNCIV